MKDTELKQLQVNAEKVVSKDSGDGKELIQRKDIKDSPFSIITIDGKSFGVMGEYRLTEEGGSIKEVQKQLEKITWNRIIQVVMILEEIKNKVKKEEV